MSDKDIRYNPLEHGSFKNIADRLAAMMPDGGNENVFKSYSKRMKKILVEQSGLSEEEFEVEMEKARIRHEKKEVKEKDLQKGKYILWHNTIMGSREVINTEYIQDVLDYLDGIKEHLDLAVLDDVRKALNSCLFFSLIHHSFSEYKKQE